MDQTLSHDEICGLKAAYAAGELTLKGGIEWGSPTGLNRPAMLVAQLRGATFGNITTNSLEPRPISHKDSQIAWDALMDVADWFGFSTVERYISHLSKGGKRVLDKLEAL